VFIAILHSIAPYWVAKYVNIVYICMYICLYLCMYICLYMAHQMADLAGLFMQIRHLRASRYRAHVYIYIDRYI